MSKHLWEANHPYYCNDGNYFSNDTVFYYNSWSEYLDEFGDADRDMNLVFRWDWKIPDPNDYDLAGEFGEPEELPVEETLHLYHMGQRKGAFYVHIVDVERSDEESIREYLTDYAEHLKKIWEPLL